jgi:hypothetical protein
VTIKNLSKDSFFPPSVLSNELNNRLWELVAQYLLMLSDTRASFARDCGASGLDMTYVLTCLLQNLSAREILVLRETLIIPELTHLQ